MKGCKVYRFWEGHRKVWGLNALLGPERVGHYFCSISFSKISFTL